jgi:hypothetical protein
MISPTKTYRWYPGSRSPRNRLRKGKKETTSFLYQKSPYKSFGVTYLPMFNKHRRSTPEWGALHRAWVGYVIAKSDCDCEKIRKYAVVIRKFQRRLNIELSDFPEIGICGIEEDYENKEEDDDSKLATYDPWTQEKLRGPKEDIDVSDR